MRTIYGYEELPYKVMQEVKERTIKTDNYIKYRNEARGEYLKETLEDFFTDYEVNYNNQITINDDVIQESTTIDLHPAIDKVQLLIYSREVNFIFKGEKYLTLDQLQQITKSCSEARTKLIDIINEIRDRIDGYEPDFEQYVQDNWYTENGKLVTIED